MPSGHVRDAAREVPARAASEAKNVRRVISTSIIASPVSGRIGLVDELHDLPEPVVFGEC